MLKTTYIKAKREKTVLFLCIDRKDSLDQVKTKLCKALDNSKTSEEVRLLVDGKNKGEFHVLEDTKTLENDSLVYFVYYDREEGVWEEVHVVQPELDDDDLEEEIPVRKEKGKGRA